MDEVRVKTSVGFKNITEFERPLFWIRAKEEFDYETPPGRTSVFREIESIKLQLSRIERKLNLIFGDSVLIDGKFKPLRDLTGAKA